MFNVPSSPAEVSAALSDHDYLTDEGLATVVYLSMSMERPLFLEGDAGVGKTELAKVLSAWTGGELIRLQCYEGLDEAKALYEWEYSKQLLYTQILKEQFTDVMQGSKSVAEAAERINPIQIICRFGSFRAQNKGWYC